jgi:outer membrane lipoprotein SlyB
MSESRSGVSPIVAIAAGSVIAFSALGIGVMTGVVPSSFSKPSDAPLEVKAGPSQPAAVSAQATKPDATEHRAQPVKPHPPAAKAAQPPVRVASAEPARVAARCADCGRVTAVDVTDQKGSGTGLGAVAGGVVGGVLGNQVGRGTGRTVATVAGAAAGAFGGNEAEKYMKSSKRYEVSVRMDDGSVRRVPFDAQPAFRAGDKVRMVNGSLVAD